MTTMRQISGGKSTVTPYVVVKGVAARFLEFVEQTFEVKRRSPRRCVAASASESLVSGRT
jgi:uncharacterized glyoxalase superfamily protein PhnB